MNFGVLMPLRLAAAAMPRLVAAGIRSDAGEVLVGLMRYKCSAFCNQPSSIGCIATKNPTCNAPNQVRMRVGITQTIARDAGTHSSLAVHVSHCGSI